ncbi:hypothetical protein, partial [Corallococcus soli]|uniref:hypothetical protein n=1 Tax=Corallococcus soli TaxID=2710757 RepID=UPI0039EED340
MRRYSMPQSRSPTGSSSWPSTVVGQGSSDKVRQGSGRDAETRAPATWPRASRTRPVMRELPAGCGAVVITGLSGTGIPDAAGG